MTFSYVLRIDEYVYFGNSLTQLEKLNVRVFSGITITSNEELSLFIKNNVNKSAYYIALQKGLLISSIKSNIGISLLQKSKQTEVLNYSSFIYSKELEIGKGIVNPKWIIDFDSPLTNTIFTVNNHRTDDINYAIQDKNHTLYFVSPNGDISCVFWILASVNGLASASTRSNLHHTMVHKLD